MAFSKGLSIREEDADMGKVGRPRKDDRNDKNDKGAKSAAGVKKRTPRGKTKTPTVRQAGVDTGEERTMWPWEKNFNIEVRRAMFEKGITQAMLAKECGINPSTLHAWLGKEMPNNLKQAFLATIKKMPARERGRSAGKV